LRPTLLRPSIFNIVKFSNDECYDGGNQSGTCYTPLECKAFGGSATAMCANGYGTCCIISKSCHNTTSQKVVYFKNPSYPSTDNQQNFCDLTIDIKDSDICQIRLDFLDFQLDPPKEGQCLGDKLTISASKQATSTIPTLCGLNRNSHIYINVPQDTIPRSVSILFVTNSEGPYRWHLRITQIECINKLGNRQQKSFFSFIPPASLKISVPAPPHCLQYYTASTGVIESFNFGDYLNNLDYAICIERLPDTCKVIFTAMDNEWSIEKTGTSLPSSGVGDEQCKSDYLMISGGSETGDGPTYDRYCGKRLNFEKDSQISKPVITKANGPIVLRFHSDQYYKSEYKEGFRLHFQQENNNCVSRTNTFSNLYFHSPSALNSNSIGIQSNNENTRVVRRSNTKRLVL
ncbi:hypothetical protein B4U79_09580, partial [Dinothrombium tinctorium]